jgi:hypothetical protein
MRTQKPTLPCRSCGQEIGFVKTKKGKNMPINAESFTDEDLEILSRVGETLDYRHGEHESHHATCPHAGDWRK